MQQSSDIQEQAGFVARLPLNVGKIMCALLLLFSAYTCVISEELPVRLTYMAFTLTLAGIYCNLAVVKISIMELFDEPLPFYGYPIFFVSTYMEIWYQYLRW